MKNTILLVLFLYICIPARAQWTVFKTGPYHFTDLVWVDSVTAYGTEGSMVFYKTTDHGKSWMEIDIEPGIAYGSLSFPTPAVGYAFTGNTNKPDSTKNGIFRTVDSGKTWHKIYPYILYGQRAHFFTPRTGFFINYGYEPEQLWYTNDSGNNWIQTNGWHGFDDWAITPTNKVYTSGYYQYEDQHGDDHQVSRLDNSTDMGYYWDARHPAIEDSSVLWGPMSWPSDKVGYVLKGGNVFSWNVLYKTIDSGLTWEKVDTSNGNFGIYFLDSLNGYKFGFRGIIKHTLDGGKTWSTENSGTSSLLGGMFKAPDNNLYIGGDSGLILYKPINKTQGIDNPNSNSFSISIFPNPNNGVFTLSYIGNSSNENLSVFIYDLMGHLLYHEIFICTGLENKISINPGIHTSGLYFLKIKNNHFGETTQKLIVE